MQLFTRRFVVLAIVLLAAPVVPVLAQANITGKWHFVFDTPGGNREFDATFQLNGHDVTGKWGNDDVQGTFADGKLNLSFTFHSDEVGPGTMKVTGELGGDSLSGNWSFQTYEGTFKASRTP
jgi:hypothetical protein